MSIKVSVIVPVYNTEKYLNKCLDSLVGQSLKEIEIIVVNDGSPDNSQMIIDEYENKYIQVRGLKKENGGLSDARNYGICHANGEFVAFVDSDDYVESTMLEAMYEEAEKNCLDIVVCDTIMEYPTHSYVLRADLGYTCNPVKSYIMAYPNAPARMIRTSLMKEHLFKVGVWYEDLQLMPTLVAYTKKIGFINQAFYHYLQRDESIMNQQNLHPKYKDIFKAFDDISEKFQRKGLYEKYYDELEYLYITHLQRSAVLRFVGMNGAEQYLKEIHEIMNAKFPRWIKNKYLKQSSWKFRLVCRLGYMKQYRFITILKKLV